MREVGSAVTGVEPGDAVILHPLITCGLCRACRAGDDVHCVDSKFPGIDTDGGMAELLLTNVRAVVKLDPPCGPRTSPRWPTRVSPPTTRCARPCRCSTRARRSW
ncbi:alcohol dehydrogenase catalytic domain-containing protein [Streptosporangium lutulentum]